jgi:hypothetical protein
MLATITQDLYNELLAVLVDGNITPSITEQNQLRDALRNIIDLRLANVSDKKVDFTPATIGQALTSGDTLSMLFSKLAYWRCEYTRNLNNHAAVDASYDTKGHLKVGPIGGLTIADGVLDLQEASTSVNGYMSSDDKTRLDNVYQSLNNHTAMDASYDTKGHLKVSPIGGLTISDGVIDLQEASTSVNGYMSSTDKTRLDNVYQAGTSLSISGQTLTLNKANSGTASSVTLPSAAAGEVLSFTSPLSKSGTTVSISAATTSAAGSMSSTDKSRLDNVYQAGTSLSISGQTLTLNKANSGTASSVTLPSSSGGGGEVLSFTSPLSKSGTTVSLAAATTSANGYMSATDKSRLDNVYQAVTSREVNNTGLELKKGNSGSSEFTTWSLNKIEYNSTHMTGLSLLISKDGMASYYSIGSSINLKQFDSISVPSSNNRQLQFKAPDGGVWYTVTIPTSGAITVS